MNATEASVFPFIVGCGRSGNTLLRAFLDSHPEMAIPGESYFLVQLGNRYARPKYEGHDGFRVDAFVEDLCATRWFSRWGPPAAEVRNHLASTRPGDIAQAFRDVYALYAARRGKRRYGDKTPTYVVRMRLLADLFPESRFVHIVRDGRDVALGMLDGGFNQTTLDECAVYWGTRVSRGREHGRALGPSRYLEIRYEEMVADPETTLQQVCGFIDLQYSEDMLRYQDRVSEISESDGSPPHYRNISRPPTRGLRDWRTQMAQHDVEVFEALAGDVLSEFGYERGAERIGVRARADARRRQAQTRARRALRRLDRRRSVARGERLDPAGKPLDV